jgi:uncharacterized membrane protein YdjX (TVP38/TMEM64 family)
VRFNFRYTFKVKKKIFIFGLLAIVFFTIQYFEVPKLFDLENLKQSEDSLKNFVQKNFLLSAVIYFFSYVFMAALSIPGAAIFTLAGGALFGLVWGTFLVSFASSIGASLAFLLSRYLFREWVIKKFSNKATSFLKNTEKNGILYIAFLRLTPVFPFFLVNVLSGISGVSIFSFYLVSQLCMFPATLIYVNAGSQLSEINKLEDILSFNVILALFLLGIIPLVGKFTVSFWKDRK